MAALYKTPGVYREDVFLQHNASLPTGIPGFIGFASAYTRLEELPEELSKELPFGLEYLDPLKDKIPYQPDKKLLFREIMSLETRNELLSFSTKEVYKTAINSLFEIAQKQALVLYRKEDFGSQLLGHDDCYLENVVNGFFENGGTRCYIVRAIVPKSATTEQKEQALIKALSELTLLNDLDLVAIPDAMTLLNNNKQLDTEAIIRVQKEALKHCAQMGDRIAILDAFKIAMLDASKNVKPEEKTITTQRQRLTANQKEPINGVLYYPWIVNSKGCCVPPCGHIAGVISRSDRNRGIFKAPANEEIFDALDLEEQIDNDKQKDLNTDGINCLRAFRGRGIRVWGARTLSQDVNWRYINVRRLFLTIGRWIDQNMLWATFEPNTPQLWVRIQRQLSVYLETLWQAGALQGRSLDEAFYIKCDAETNSSETYQQGEVVTEIGLAPNSPAEFIIVRIVHRIGTVEIE